MRVANWEKWQTFRKDRGTPSWIKVYRNLFSNENWVALSDAEKGQLVSIWILAADKSGEIPDNPNVIKKMTLLDEAPNINKFIGLGLLVTERQPSDNQPVTILADTVPNMTNKSREEERRVEESRGEKSKDTSAQKNDVKKTVVDRFKNWPGEPDKTLFDDWMTARKKKKAAFTQTAFNGLGRKLTEAVALGLDLNECVQCAAEKGWASFNVEWYFNENPEKRQQVTRPSSEFERPSSGQPEKQRETIGDVECPEDL